MNVSKCIDYQYYKTDIERYKENFENKIKELNDVLNLLKSNGRISAETNIEARIKSYKSFYDNMMDNRNVDDCFGIKIIANEKDLHIIEESVKSIFNIKKIKDHSQNLNTKYNALHLTVMSNNTEKNGEAELPIELQLWTKENSNDRLPHDIYKMQNFVNIKNDETTVKAVYEEFYRLLALKVKENEVNEKIKNKKTLTSEEKKYRTGFEEKLPTYYVMESGKLNKLGQKESIKKLFPTVIATAKKDWLDDKLNKLFKSSEDKNNKEQKQIEEK